MESPPASRKIEIVMAVHRPSLEFLRKQIASIRNQSYANWGLSLVIDGTDPALLDVTREWLEEDPRIHQEVLPNHVGSCRTFEHGLLQLKGRDCLVALADQDDIWHPRKLELLESALRQNPATFLAFCDSSIIDDQDAVISPSLHASEKRVPAFGIASLMARNSISGHAQLFRSELLDAAVPFSGGLHTLGLHHDHWLAMVAALKGPIHFLNQALVEHRLHDRNQIGPRIRRKSPGSNGFFSWATHNRHLRRVLEARHQLLGELPGYPKSPFSRRRLLAWGATALLDRNPPAAAIYFRAFCASQLQPEALPACL